MLPFRPLLLLLAALLFFSSTYGYPVLARNYDDASSDQQEEEASAAPLLRRLIGLRGREDPAVLNVRIDLPLAESSLAKLLVQGSVQNFPSLTESYSLLEELESRYPALCKSFTIGRSVEGRDIRVWAIGEDVKENYAIFDGEQCVAEATPLEKPSVLLTALHHAREPASLTVVLYAAIQLLDLGTNLPASNATPLQQLAASAAAYLLATHIFLVLPFVNPDGYATIEATGHRDIRKNRRQTCGDLKSYPAQQGVDLNRNYDYNFDNLHSPCDAEEYEGSYAFSEPETQAVKCLVESLRPTAALNFHGYGGFWTRPFNCCKGKDVPEPLNSCYNELAAAVNVTGFGPAPRMPLLMYTTTGEADDWMLATAGVLAMSPEVGHEHFGFWPPAAVVPEINEETLWHIFDVAMKAGAALSVVATPTETQVLNHGLKALPLTELDFVAFELHPVLQMRYPPNAFFSSASIPEGSKFPFCPYAWTRQFKHRRRLQDQQTGSSLSFVHARLEGPLEARSAINVPTVLDITGDTAFCLASPGHDFCYCGRADNSGVVAPLVPLRLDTEPCLMAIDMLPVKRAELYAPAVGAVAKSANVIEMATAVPGDSYKEEGKEEKEEESESESESESDSRHYVPIGLAGIAVGAASVHSLLLFCASRDGAVESRPGRLARKYAIMTTGLFCCLPPCIRLNRRLRQQGGEPPRTGVEQEMVPPDLRGRGGGGGSPSVSSSQPYFAPPREHPSSAAAAVY